MPTRIETETALRLHQAFIEQSPKPYNTNDKFAAPSALWSDSYGRRVPAIIIQDFNFDPTHKAMATETMRKAMVAVGVRKAKLVFMEIVRQDGKNTDGPADEHVIVIGK